MNTVKVILLENIANLGKLGEEVGVKPGFARNYLMPQHKAVMLTEENRALFEQKRAEYEQRAKAQLAESEKQADQIRALEQIEISARVAEGGKLYGSIGLLEIIRAIQEAGIEVAKKDLRMPQGPIREIGEYTIEVHFVPEIIVPLKVNVLPIAA